MTETRPPHGLRLEEALERWSDPEAWAEVEALIETLEASGRPRGRRLVPGVRANAVFKRVLAEFQRRLRDAEIIVSATDAQPDLTDPRFVVDPDIMRGVEIRFDLNAIIGAGIWLHNPEIFAPDAIPLNIREVPEWLRDRMVGIGAPPAARTVSAGGPRESERPARGIPLEQALERWSDSDAYAAMREYWAHKPSLFITSTGDNPLEQEFNRRRRPLEEAFVERLQLGELMASAIPENADITAPRTLLDPEIFRVGSPIYEMDIIVGLPGGNLTHVEVFEPPGVPRNIRIIPDWYWEQIEPAQTALRPSDSGAGEAPGEAGFRQEAGYRRVWINGHEFRLTHLHVERRAIRTPFPG